MDKAQDQPFLTAEEWKSKGFFVPVFKKNIFVIDTEGEHKECIVILHGYLTSSYDYHKILPQLSQHYRVVLIDFIGFGFSDREENNYFTIIDQTDYLTQVLHFLEVKNITLLTHDYSNLIAKEIIARQNASITFFDIKKIIFCNGSIPVNHFNYLDIHTYYKDEDSKKMISMLTSFGVYKKIMQEYFFNKEKITDDELHVMWTLLTNKNGRDIINFIYHYVRERKIFWNRWILALENSTIPIQLIWGKEDVISDDSIPNLENENIVNHTITWIEKTGHYPMLETPEALVECIVNSK